MQEHYLPVQAYLHYEKSRGRIILTSSITLKRLGNVKDIAFAALFLASKETKLITRQTTVVDNGQLISESLTLQKAAGLTAELGSGS